MASCFKYFSALVEKHWKDTDVNKIVFTPTPLKDLSQRSIVELDMVPFLLANSVGSVFRDISGNHTIISIGKYRCMGFDFYRAYLSGDAGSFLHLVVDTNKPNDIIECRIYQKDSNIAPLYANRQEQVSVLGESIDEAQNWEFWLLDDPDPAYGGMIGCPVMVGKNIYDDYGKLVSDPKQYSRTWNPGDKRIAPILATEHIVDLNGEEIKFDHTMMHYSRMLSDGLSSEYFLASVVETDDTADINMWVGLDIKPSNMNIYSVNAK